MQFRIFLLLLITGISLSAGGMNLNNLGEGGVNLSMDGDARSIEINPANIPPSDHLRVMLTNSTMLNGRTWRFVQELSTNDSEKIATLMKKNIAHPLTLLNDTFFALYHTTSQYRWLMGLSNRVEGTFITHTGFGSMGAMESFVDRYTTLIGSVARTEAPWRYGLNLRHITRYQTIHNYTIAEMIQTDNLLDYFDNAYTQSNQAMALDVGGVYQTEMGKIGFSVLDVGNTAFDTFDTLPARTNIGFSSQYQGIEWGIDAVDILHASFKESLRMGLHRDFDRLRLKTGLLHEKITWGIAYQFTYFNMALNGYDDNYQLQLSLVW